MADGWGQLLRNTTVNPGGIGPVSFCRSSWMITVPPRRAGFPCGLEAGLEEAPARCFGTPRCGFGLPRGGRDMNESSYELLEHDGPPPLLVGRHAVERKCPGAHSGEGKDLTGCPPVGEYEKKPLEDHHEQVPPSPPGVATEDHRGSAEDLAGGDALERPAR